MDFYLYMGWEPSKPPSERLGRHKGELGERQGMDAILNCASVWATRAFWASPRQLEPVTSPR